MRKQRLEFIFLSQKKRLRKETSPLHLICRDTDPCFKYQRSLSISISNDSSSITIHANKDQPTSANIPSANSLSHPPVYDRAIEHQSKDKHARSKVCSFPRSPVHPLLPPAHLETRSRSAIKPFRGNDSFPDH